MDNKIVIEVDDQFTPKQVSISTKSRTFKMCLGDNKSSDNTGGGAYIRITDDDGTDLHMYLPKSAVNAIKEVFRNSPY